MVPGISTRYRDWRQHYFQAERISRCKKILFWQGASMPGIPVKLFMEKVPDGWQLWYVLGPGNYE